MRLNNYLHEDLVLPAVEASDLSSVLATFGEAFEQGGYVAAGADVAKALQAREESHTTCLGHRIAVPHATIPGLTRALIMVATAAEPIPFGSSETEPVELFFVLLSPPGSEGEHIKLLARICRLAQHPEDLVDIKAARDGATLLEAVLRLDSRHV